MRRAVEKYIEDPMAEEVLRGHIKPGDTVTVQKDGDKLGFVVVHSKEEKAEAETPAASGQEGPCGEGGSGGNEGGRSYSLLAFSAWAFTSSKNSRVMKSSLRFVVIANCECEKDLKSIYSQGSFRMAKRFA